MQFKTNTGKYKRISIKIYGYADEWSKEAGMYIDQRTRSKENKKIMEAIDKARTILDQMQEEYEVYGTPFDFNRFSEIYKYKEQEKATEHMSEISTTLSGFLGWYIDQLTKQDRIGDRSCFKTMNSVLRSQKVSEHFPLNKIDKY